MYLICLGNRLVHRTRWDLACKLSFTFSRALKNAASDNGTRYRIRDEWKSPRNACTTLVVFAGVLRVRIVMEKDSGPSPGLFRERARATSTCTCTRMSGLVYLPRVCVRVCAQWFSNRRSWRAAVVRAYF